MLSAASRTISCRGTALARLRLTTKGRRFDSSIKKEAAEPPRKSSNDDSRISPWYPIVGGLVITIAGGIKYCHDLFGGMEGLERAAAFYSLAIPRYVQYRFHMLKESPDDVWDSLHTETSQDALNIMLQLKGFYIKSGQICASNLGNAFPDIWIDTLSVLQDEVSVRLQKCYVYFGLIRSHANLLVFRGRCRFPPRTLVLSRKLSNPNMASPWKKYLLHLIKR